MIGCLLEKLGQIKLRPNPTKPISIRKAVALRFGQSIHRKMKEYTTGKVLAPLPLYEKPAHAQPS